MLLKCLYLIYNTSVRQGGDFHVPSKFAWYFFAWFHLAFPFVLLVHYFSSIKTYTRGKRSYNTKDLGHHNSAKSRWWNVAIKVWHAHSKKRKVTTFIIQLSGCFTITYSDIQIKNVPTLVPVPWGNFLWMIFEIPLHHWVKKVSWNVSSRAKFFCNYS